MLKLSSCDNEYYLGDLPGTLQYSKDIDEILKISLPDNQETRGFKLCEHSIENLRRVTPTTQKNNKWKIVLMMKTERPEHNEVWLKSALLNKETGKIALITATNSKLNLERNGYRTVKTIDGEWFVGHYRMGAPIIFWSELKNRLLY